MAFKLETGTFEWLGDYDISVEELLSGYSSDSKKQKAEDFIKKVLISKSTVPANEIFTEGKKLGISKRTIENVKQELGVKSVRVGANWHWSINSEE